MSTAPPPDTVTGKVDLQIGDDRMSITLTLGTAPAPLSDLLPVFQGVASALTDRAAARDEAPGRTVSCRAGCGACCRQPVPIARAEARALAALVDAMPAPRQAVIRDRFAAGRALLGAADVLIRLDSLKEMPVERQMRWGNAYFTTGVPCPFLDDESCSIYPDRPTVCREYLVTTPAANCTAPTPATVRRIPIPASVAASLIAAERDADGEGPVLLIDSLDWAAANPPAAPDVTPAKQVEAVFAKLAKAL